MAEKVIGGETFKVEKLAATTGLSLLTRLTKILGPGLRHLNEAFDADEGKRDAAALVAMADIVATIDEQQFQLLIIQVTEFAAIRVNNAYEPVIFDHHFQDDLLKAFQVFVFVLEVNYKSFFGGLTGSAVGKRILGSPKSSSET